MSYAEQAEQYSDGAARQRFNMCIREQGAIFANDGRPDIAALGVDVVAGKYEAIEAVVANICTGPNWDTLDEDQALLSAVQAGWPTVAAALYPPAA